MLQMLSVVILVCQVYLDVQLCNAVLCYFVVTCIWADELRTLRNLDTSALVWWVRTIRTDRHWCQNVLKTVRT